MRSKAITVLVGARVRALRKRQSLSAEKLAERAGIDPTYLGGIERGTRNPSLRVLARLAKALHVDPPALLDIHEGADEDTLRAEALARVKGLSVERLRLMLRLLDAIA